MNASTLRRLLTCALPACVLALFIGQARGFCRHEVYFVDDPFISMRYAAGLFQRGELAFNPGDRVEGYSNLLHVLLHAFTFVLRGRVPDAFTAAQDATLLVLAATALQIAAFVALARRDGAREAEATAWYYAGLLTVAWWPFAFWATAGLETPVEGLLYTAVVLVTTRMARPSGARGSIPLLAVLLIAVTLLRFEGVIVALAATGVLGLHLWTRDRKRDAVALAAPVTIVAVAYHVWRIVYFGALLPNTFTAKATGGSPIGRLVAGASYCGGWIGVVMGGVALALLALAATVGWERVRVSLASALGAPVPLVAGTFVVVKVALVVWGGGDWMPGWRMLVPITPLALFLLVRAVLTPLGEGRDLRVAGWPALALGLMLVLSSRNSGPEFPQHNGIPNEVGGWKKLPRGYVAIGDVLERAFGGGREEVAVGEAGLIPYEARSVRFMDLFGLVDRDMARQPGGMHTRVHVAHVVERAPGAVTFAHLHVQPPYGPYQYGRELLGSPLFHEAYRRVDLGQDMEDLGWALYVRRDLDPGPRGLAWAASDPYVARAQALRATAAAQ